MALGREPRLRRGVQRGAPARPAATCSSSSTPTRGRCRASARRSAGPWREDAAGRRGWALVACEHARSVNTPGNAVHFTGIAWAGGHGDPIPDGARRRSEVTAASGACLAVPPRGLATSRRLSRASSSSTTRTSTSRCGCGSAGGALGIEPTAVVDHDYEFGSSPHKWRWLERNRWALLIRVYPAPLLVFVAPALLVTEAGAARRRRCAAAGSARSWRPMIDVARWLPRLLRERREIQARRAITAERLRRLADPRPRLALHRRRARSGADALAAARLLARRHRLPGAAARARPWRRLRLRSAATPGGSGSR